jgi:hypothetical protein
LRRKSAEKTANRTLEAALIAIGRDGLALAAAKFDSIPPNFALTNRLQQRRRRCE